MSGLARLEQFIFPFSWCFRVSEVLKTSGFSYSFLKEGGLLGAEVISVNSTETLTFAIKKKKSMQNGAL